MVFTERNTSLGAKTPSGSLCMYKEALPMKTIQWIPYKADDLVFGQFLLTTTNHMVVATRLSKRILPFASATSSPF